MRVHRDLAVIPHKLFDFELGQDRSRVGDGHSPGLALGGQHLLEHVLEFDVHLHPRLTENADDGGSLFDGELDVTVFELTCAKLLAAANPGCGGGNGMGNGTAGPGRAGSRVCRTVGTERSPTAARCAPRGGRQ